MNIAMQTPPNAFSDMPVTGWIGRFAPRSVQPYLRLMRLDRPIGIWLLLLPGWWSIALADGDGWTYALFGIGAVVMRGAGCTVNDIVDRDLDAQVARTAARPLASGALRVRQAVGLLIGLLAIGCLVLVQFNGLTIALGVAALPLVAIYPLMKRLTDWPQAWLGMTFNWGALLGWTAVHDGIALPPILLYVAGLFWTLGYDTIYAHQDKDDDAIVGIRSTALRLGRATKPAVGLFYGATALLIAASAWTAGLGLWFWPLWAAAATHLAWQIATLDIDNPADCLAKFRANRVFGWIVLAALLAGSPL